MIIAIPGHNPLIKNLKLELNQYPLKLENYLKFVILNGVQAASGFSMNWA